MKRFTIFLLVSFFSIVTAEGVLAQLKYHNCGTQDLHIHKMQTDSEYAREFEAKQKQFQRNLERIKRGNHSRAVGDCPTDKIVIPVAVHYEFNANASQQACLIQLAEEQIALMNTHFSGASCAVTGVGSCIKFQLADQNHPASSGLADGTKAVTFNEAYGCDDGDPFTCSASLADWAGYLNLVVQDANSNPDLLGIAPLGGSPNGTSAVLTSSCAWGATTTTCAASINGFVGSASCNTNFSANTGGTTCTHEVGHYFNLLHTFCADGSNIGVNNNSGSSGSVTAAQSAECQNNGVCGGGCVTTACDCDGVTDTPAQAFAEYGCPGGSATGTAANPSTGVSYDYNNFMDYVDDACMNCFTPMQKDRIVAQCDATRAQYAADKFIQDVSPPTVQNIPTMSEWGLIIFGLLILNLGVGFIKRKETVFT